jgi:hypothetical protein
MNDVVEELVPVPFTLAVPFTSSLKPASVVVPIPTFPPKELRAKNLEAFAV